MGAIASVNQTIKLAKEAHAHNKTIVLVGGCFDLVHVGHLQFLRQAKKRGNMLILLLESDETVRALKGEHRPINTQKDRALLLAEFRSVDVICLLPQLTSNKEYDNLVLAIKPAIIATTRSDPAIRHKRRQAKLVGARLATVTGLLVTKSTSMLAGFLKRETI